MRGRFLCECMAGYHGNLCQHAIDECDSNPCQNNGQCHDIVDGFTCTCPPGTSGLL